MDDPRERLKRYLEQRKELGERELVLDGMTVDEVMNIVGAMGSGTIRPPAQRKPRPRDDSAVTDASGDPPATDWRAALRASGAAPEPRPSVREPWDAQAGTSVGAEAEGADVRAGLQRATEPPGDVPVAPKPPTSKAAPRTAAASTPPTPAVPVSNTPAAPATPPSTSKRYEFPRPMDTISAGSGQPPTPLPASSASAAPGATSAGVPAAASPAAHRVPGVDAPLGLVVGNSDRDLFGTSVGKLATLAEIAEVVAGCQRCPLYSTATNPVPGEGNPAAELVVVGEAPGANEDATGRPFVGQSGELLTKILGAISLKREDVFICNVLKHRPPGNRNPLPEEVVACSPYLVQQLELIRPKVIVAFGTFAAQTLLNTKLPIGKLRGSIHRYHGVPLIVTYHPAALLRNPAWKRPTWEDVQLARRILDNAPRA